MSNNILTNYTLRWQEFPLEKKTIEFEKIIYIVLLNKFKTE